MLGDCAMGTMLQGAGLALGAAPEAWNLQHPLRVSAVHQEAAQCGASWVRTNTFGGNRTRLTLAGLETHLEAVNRAGIVLARAAGRPVVASVGPTGATTTAEWERVYQEQVAALGLEGPDGYIVETVVSIGEGEAAVRAAAAMGQGPVWASFTPDWEGNALDGTPLEQMTERLVAAGAAGIGVNCGYGPELMLPAAGRLVRMGIAPVLAMPNAGLPQLLDGMARYSLKPDAFARAAIQFQEVGVKFFGGCCGTTPEHLRAADAALRKLSQP